MLTITTMIMRIKRLLALMLALTIVVSPLGMASMNPVNSDCDDMEMTSMMEMESPEMADHSCCDTNANSSCHSGCGIVAASAIPATNLYFNSQVSFASEPNQSPHPLIHRNTAPLLQPPLHTL